MWELRARTATSVQLGPSTGSGGGRSRRRGSEIADEKWEVCMESRNAVRDSQWRGQGGKQGTGTGIVSTLDDVTRGVARGREDKEEPISAGEKAVRVMDGV